MGRYKVKESHPITLRMELELYDQLEEFCNEFGQSKTIAVERAVKEYIEKNKLEKELINSIK